MMFKLTVDPKPLNAKLAQLQVNILNLPQAMANAMQGQQGKLANRVLQRLTTIPGPPVYPIRWKSERQRRAFFASKGFGKGIPTRRTYAIVKGWHVVYLPTQTGGAVSLINEVPGMQYVQGDNVQPFHLDTGWVQRGDVVDDFIRETSEQVTATWFDVAEAAIVEEKR